MDGEEKRKLRVFLNYASEDREAVLKLYQRLVAAGIEAWLDIEKLLPGQKWRLKIDEAIASSDAVIVCISKHSITKEGYVQKEIKDALEKLAEKPDDAIYLIPAKIEECEVPARLSELQWVDLFDEKSFDRLIQALRLRAERVNASLPVTNESAGTFTKPSSPPQVDDGRRTPIVFLGLTAVALIIISVIISSFVQHWLTAAPASPPADSPSPVSVLSPTLTMILPHPTSTPTLTFTPPPASTPTLTPTSTALPDRMVDEKGVAMALIPAGELTMGNNKGLSPEKPEHLVFLSAYYIDVYEVTNASYAACQTDGACPPPTSNRSRTFFRYYSDPAFANFPVVYVNWEMAQAYCSWRMARLPTEAEWEKAARGADQRLFPNGAGMSCTLANYCRGDTTPAGRYQESPSPYGLYDMAGNVAEWVADWYSAGYYGASSPENPTGPAAGQLRVVRGGSFNSSAHTELQTTARAALRPDSALDYVGFRCVREP